MKSATIVWLAVGLLVFAGGTVAQEAELRAGSGGHATLTLAEVLEVAARNSRREILVDSRTPSQVVIGQVGLAGIDYPTLLGILRNNGMAAVVIGNVTSIVPVEEIRQHPLPVLLADDDTVDGEEWVTRIITLENALATNLVPILRPLLPRHGHLAANPESNSLIIADRYANVRRIAELIREIERNSKQPAD